jgi:hypothetical protein
MRRHPFCLSLRVAADARLELASSDRKSDILPLDESADCALKNPNLQQDGVSKISSQKLFKSSIRNPVALLKYHPDSAENSLPIEHSSAVNMNVRTKYYSVLLSYL